jgi:pantoate kinase
VIRDEAYLVEAFAPGHVTGFFAIRDESEEPERIGSVGAGFSVEQGVSSRVHIQRQGFPGVDLRIDGAVAEAETTRTAVELVLAREPWNVWIEQSMGLPIGQGFGMSAAGALSAALAVAAALGRSREDALWAAHSAEVVNRTGLGDAVGAFHGGFEVRRQAGLPPHGRVEVFDRTRRPVALAVVGGPLATRSILGDSGRRQRIQTAGRDALQRLGTTPDVAGFVAASDAFARQSGLRGPDVQAALDALPPGALAGQCMLGGSVFVLDPTSDVGASLPKGSQVVSTCVDVEGARVTSAPQTVEPRHG